MARREERAYREYVSDEQRSQAGCIGGQSGAVICRRVLSAGRRSRMKVMSFCEHCEGQRFDRAQVLRVLRATRKNLRKQRRGCRADEALDMAIKAVRALEIPHLEKIDDLFDDQIVH
jgi:imidazolonepropionase-like amidohydrolase